jgi:serine/threonine-protein phosphatase 6 regulatory ankyrin repeat subunit B
MLASYKGHIEIAKLLLEKGASLDIQNTNGNTALIRASSYGHTEIVEILIQKGAKLDIQDINFYNTALMFASYRGHTEIVRLLVKKGADIYIEDKRGKTALDYAKNNEIKKILLKAKEERNERSGQEFAIGYEKMTGQSARPGTGPANLIKKFAGINSPRGYKNNRHGGSRKKKKRATKKRVTQRVVR